MSKKIKRFQDRKSAVVKLMREMSDKLEAEDRQFNDEEKASYAKLEAELSSLNDDIKREEKLAEIEKTMNVVPDRNGDTADQANEKNGVNALANKYPATYSRFGSLKAYNQHSSKEENLRSAYRAGMWLLGVIDKDGPAGQKARAWCSANGLGAEALASQTGSTNAGGGALVPTELSSSIIDLREQYGVFRQNVSVIPMMTDMLSIPRRTSGLTAYFVNDTDATTESTKSYDNVQLSAKELAALVRYPITLAEDTVINLADDLTYEIGYQFALKEDQCGFIGDGTSTYGGIYGVATKINSGSYAGSIATAASGNVSFETLDMDDFDAAMGKLPNYALQSGNAKWYISQYGWATSMQRLAQAAGGNTVQGVAGGFGMMFLGYPVVISQVLNSTVGSDVSKIKCLFGDLGAAAKMGSRRDVTIQVSADRYFEYGHIGIRGSERFDIVVHDLGDGTTAGPIVALKTAAS